MRMGIYSRSPFTDLPASLPQIPPAQFAYQASFLSNWNKFVWTEQASRGVLPSQQRLKTDNLCGSQVDNRLIKIAKFFPFDRVTQISLQLQSSHHTGSHIRVKHLVTRFAQGLGSIHGRVGISQDIFRLLVG